MCRHKHIRGHRCPSDTSAARAARRRAERARKANPVDPQAVASTTATAPEDTLIVAELTRAERINAVRDIHQQLSTFRKGEPVTRETLTLIQEAGEHLAVIIDEEAPLDETAGRAEDLITRTEKLLGTPEGKAAWHVMECNKGEITEWRRDNILRRRGVSREVAEAKASELTELVAHTADARITHEEAITARRETTRKVLAEVRNMGGTYNATTSNKKAAQELENVTHNFPTDWIDGSNTHTTPLEVNHKKGRAHYSQLTIEEITAPPVRAGTKASPVTTPSMREAGPVVAKPGTKAHRAAQATLNNTERKEYQNTALFYETTQYITSRSEDAPKGNGWTKREDGTWVRPVNRKHRIIMGGPSANYEPGDHRALTHELAHHVEVTHPHVLEAEAALYAERTEGKEPYVMATTSGKRELSRDGGWVAPYIGRDYASEDSVDKASHYEILSVGMEAVFYDRYGGLSGRSRYRADEGHRNFTLGILATA